MKKATVKYVQCKGEVAEGIIFDSITDIKLLSPSLKQAEVSVLRKFVKSGESPSRLNHIVSGFSPLEYCISSLAMAKSQFNKNDNPLYLLGESSEVYLAQIVALIMRYGCVFMNDKGGLCPMFDKDGGNYLEVLESEVITEYPKRSWLNYKIGENTKYIVLENDCELERKAIDYLETVDRWNYSYVKELIMFDEDNLKLVFDKFVKAGGKVVYVYTTGINNEQMYQYSTSAISSGIKKFEFYFNSGMDNNIRAFVSWLSGKDGISVKVLNN